MRLGVQFVLCPDCLVLCVVLNHTIESSLAKCGFEKIQGKGRGIQRQGQARLKNSVTFPRACSTLVAFIWWHDWVEGSDYLV